MRLLIFGTGLFYQNRKEAFDRDTIVGFLDNDEEKIGQQYEGRVIFRPNQAEEFDYDAIVVMSASAVAMKRQMLALGVQTEKILFYGEYYKQTHVPEEYTREKNREKKQLLIITDDMRYNGGALAAVYLAIVVEQIGWSVTIATRSCDRRLKDEVLEKNLSLLIRPDIPYLEGDEDWIAPYELVIANTFLMLRPAVILSRSKRVIWWIHEPSDLYRPTLEEFPEFATEESLGKVKIYAVSSIARKNFHQYFSNLPIDILPYGIPDEWEADHDAVSREKVVFTIIGAVCKNKNQRLFLEAVESMEPTFREQALFLVIGNIQGDDYGTEVRKIAECIPEARICGIYSREEMREAFREIDIVVCPSKEETMSIVVTEAMMHSRIGITSDQCGISDFIEDGKSGFIVKTDDMNDMKEKMEWVILNKEKLPEIGKNARMVYEKNFSMGAFGERLERILNA